MKVICAYAVNLDGVCDIRAEALSPLLPPSLAWEDIGLRESIASFEDLLCSLLFCMREGRGAEIAIESRALASQIEGAFSWQMRLGGNAGIMANVLADLGAKPLLNAPFLGPRTASLLRQGVQVPFSGALADPRRAAEEGEGDREPVHFIFQFQKGETMATGGRSFSVPEEDRFIASYDPANASLHSSRSFDAYCRENISDYDGALVSGFHLVSGNDSRRVFPEKMDQMRSWKRRNPDLFIHLEMGSFQSPQIMSYLLDQIIEVPPDSLGMNQDELAEAAGLLGEWPVASLPRTWQEILQAAWDLQDQTGLFRVAVHTRDYILSVMREGRLSARDEMFALERGVDAAASLAATGSMRAAPPRKFNPEGLQAARELRRLGADAIGRGASHHYGGRIVSLSPSRQAEAPLISVGLGDTATASIFFHEVGAMKSVLSRP